MDGFYSVPSKDDLTSATRSPLPGNEQYIAEVIEAGEITKPNYDGETQDFLKVKFNIESFKDGTDLEDIEGEPVVGGRWIWRDIDFGRVGFKQDGTPSIARQFFLAVMGIEDTAQPVPRVTKDDIMGKRVVLNIIVYTRKDGALGNKITSISPVVARRGRKAAAQAAPAPAAEEPEEVSEEYKAALDSLINMTPEEQEA